MQIFKKLYSVTAKASSVASKANSAKAKAKVHLPGIFPDLKFIQTEHQLEPRKLTKQKAKKQVFKKDVVFKPFEVNFTLNSDARL